MIKLYKPAFVSDGLFVLICLVASGIFIVALMVSFLVSVVGFLPTLGHSWKLWEGAVDFLEKESGETFKRRQRGKPSGKT